MEHTISAGQVKTVVVNSAHAPGWNRLRLVVMHELTPERAHELEQLLEKVLVDAVTTWASA